MPLWKAVALHLAISLAVFALVAIGVCLIWYPPVLWPLSGLGKVSALVASTVIVIGPLLGLLALRSNKPRRRTDLSIVVLLQVLALAFGLHICWLSRPVFIVAAGDLGRFYLVFANDIDPAELAALANTQQFRLPAFGAQLVGLQRPLSQVFRLNLLPLDADRSDLPYQPHRYLPYAKVRAAMRAHTQASTETGDCSAPLLSRRGLAAIRVDCQSGDFIGPARPYAAHH